MINTQSSGAEKVGMQDAIKMINNSEKQCLAASWGHQADEEDNYCLSHALLRLLTRYRDGVHDSARLIRIEKKGYFQDVGVFFFLCLPSETDGSSSSRR